MKNRLSTIALVATLAAFCGHVSAKWKQISDDLYVDDESMQRYGDHREILQLTNFFPQEVAPGTFAQSNVIRMRYNCYSISYNKTSVGRSAVMSLIAYEGRMGKGRVVLSSKEERDWERVERETVGMKIMEALCSGELGR